MGKKKRDESFGARLKRLREKEGQSIEDLAAQVGMKASHLADLEANRMLPPVAEIITLARSLAVEPSAFMGAEPAKASPHRRRQARARRTTDYAYETLTPEEHDKHLMAFRVTIDPEKEHPKLGYRHEGEEFIYVLSGKLKITVGRKTTSLGPGGSEHFDSGIRHVLKNPGREPAVLVVVIYTP
ncbi:MAG TPA: XRE family transcriptional regulator [bacterium]|nr:XRE family transcriptional regulator [bacterium]